MAAPQKSGLLQAEICGKGLPRTNGTTSGDKVENDIKKQPLPVITLTTPDHDDTDTEQQAGHGLQKDPSGSITSTKQLWYNTDDAISSSRSKSLAEPSDSFKLIHDVITLAKRWKKRTQESQARKELDVEAEREQRKALAALHLPKRVIFDITEETLSIVVATEHKYRHHLGTKHPLTIKAMMKANSLCAELGKDPIYTLP